MNANLEPLPPSGARHRSPPLLPVGIVYTALFLGSLAGSTLAASGAHFPSPFGPTALSAAYFAEHAGAVRLGAFLQFGAAVPLAIFTTTLVDRLRFLGMKVAGTVIALYGGLAASIFLALSAMVQWVLAQQDVATQPGAARLLQVRCGIAKLLRLISTVGSFLAPLQQLGCAAAGANRVRPWQGGVEGARPDRLVDPASAVWRYGCRLRQNEI
jgi:hypothetical protein